MSARARRLLIRAHAAVSEGDHPSARRAISEAMKDANLRGAAGARVLEAAGWLAFVAHDHHRALGYFDAMGHVHPPALTRATSCAVQCAGRLGWSADVRTRLAAALKREPQKLRWHVELARLHTAARAWEPARRALMDATRLEPGNARLWLELAEVSSHATRTLGGRPAWHTGDTTEAVVRAFRIDPAKGPDDQVRLRAAVAALTRVGALDRADQHLYQALELDPNAAWAYVELAERALWLGVDEGAEKRRDQAVARGVEPLAVARLDAALALRAGDFETAAHAPGEGDYRLHVWRAEAHLRLAARDPSAYERAHAELTRASMSAGGFLPVAWVLRMLVSIRQDGVATMRPARYGEVRELMQLVPGGQDLCRDGPHEEADGMFEQALKKLEGNRSTTPTYLAGGFLARMRPITGERFASRRALESIRSAPIEDSLGSLEDLSRRFEGFSLPDAHRGELLVWLGRTEEARVALDKAIAIETETRWAYIGLSMCDLLEGDPEAAYRTSRRGVAAMHDTLGPAVHVHEGEALMRMGQHERAAESLAEALRLHSSRMSARLLQILNDRAAGEPSDDDANRAIADAPGLFSDARLALEARGIVAEGEDPEVDVWLNEALRLMRGNRASRLITYVTDDGALRFVPTRGEGHRRPHDGDIEDIERAARALAIASRPRSAPAVDREPPRHRESVAAESLDIAAFEREGYVALRGAWPLAEAARWRARTLENIRRRARATVVNFDPNAEYADFDPDQPESWPASRMSVSGADFDRLGDLAPTVADAVVRLTAREALRRAPVGDYVVLNLDEDAGVQPGHTPWRWHIDNPSTKQRMDNLRNAILMVVLLDDVALDQGPTYVLPRSHRHVAARVARDEEVDLSDPAVVSELAPTTSTATPLFGSCGDVFLLHPWMLHTGSPNGTGRIRWAANPMLVVDTPFSLTDPMIPVANAVRGT